MKKGYEVSYQVRKKVFITEKQYKDIDTETLKKVIAEHEGVEEENIRFVLDNDKNLLRKV